MIHIEHGVLFDHIKENNFIGNCVLIIMMSNQGYTLKFYKFN